MSRSVALLLCVLSLPLLADDVTIGWIGRAPALDYAWGSTNPKVDGWPLAGTTVTWRAHVRSWAAAPRPASYVWRIDGVEAKRGTTTLAANGTTVLELPWLWAFDRHQISLSVDGAKDLAVFSDALSVGFWVEQSIYDHHRANQHKLGIGSASWEDWAQRTVGFYNDMAALAVYPETPNGVSDRWRIQKIVVVPDGSLPLNGLPLEATPGANGNTHPDKDDRSVDLQWGFRAATLGGYSNLTAARPSNAFYLSTVVLHEMGHARYLADVYAWNVRHDPPNFVIAIEENGTPVVGTKLVAPQVFRTPEQGLMNTHGTFLDRYSAIALEKIAGHRATQGNYNEPRNFASFLNDFPRENRVTIRNRAGEPLADADVWIYQSAANAPAWYATHYDNEPDLKLRTDAFGRVLVGRSPFSPTGQVVHTYGTTNGVAIVRVEKNGAVDYGFLESRLFNLAYWRGDTELAEHELTVGAKRCTTEGPELTAPLWDEAVGSTVTLKWKGLSGSKLYRVWASAGMGAPRIVASTTATSATVHLQGSVYWWVEADVNECGRIRSETGRFKAPLPKQRAVRRR
jgi:hypothetical protein